MTDPLPERHPEERNFRWAYALLIELAKCYLDDANDQASPGEWPMQQSWEQLGSTSRSSLLRVAREVAGIPHEEFLAGIRSGRYDVDDLYDPPPATPELPGADVLSDVPKPLPYSTYRHDVLERHPEGPNYELIALLARRWSKTSEWRFRAELGTKAGALLDDAQQVHEPACRDPWLSAESVVDLAEACRDYLASFQRFVDGHRHHVTAVIQRSGGAYWGDLHGALVPGVMTETELRDTLNSLIQDGTVRMRDDDQEHDWEYLLV